MVAKGWNYMEFQLVRFVDLWAKYSLKLLMWFWHTGFIKLESIFLWSRFSQFPLTFTGILMFHTGAFLETKKVRTICSFFFFSWYQNLGSWENFRRGLASVPLAQKPKTESSSFLYLLTYICIWIGKKNVRAVWQPTKDPLSQKPLSERRVFLQL